MQEVLLAHMKACLAIYDNNKRYLVLHALVILSDFGFTRFLKETVHMRGHNIWLVLIPRLNHLSEAVQMRGPNIWFG